MELGKEIKTPALDMIHMKGLLDKQLKFIVDPTGRSETGERKPGGLWLACELETIETRRG